MVRNNVTGAGTYTAALAFGGSPGPHGNKQRESWNKSSWTEVSDLNTTRFVTGAGIVEFIST